MKEFGAASSTGGEEVQPLLEKDILLIHDRSLSFLLKLTTEDGKMPASEDSRFRHDFGRDLMECAYFIAEANRQEPVTDLGRHFLPQLWQRTKQAVFKFWETNQLPIGQLPHEVKPYNEKDANNPFFHEQEGRLVNDDSVDATPLGLIVTSDYINSKAELEVFLPRVLKALDWMTHNMDTEGYNKWLCYKYNDHNGGHINQGWMDTKDSITYGVRSSPKDRPVPPIALVEVQGYAWKALHVWADILSTIDPTQSQKLLFRAKDLKRRFNEKFVMEDEHGAYLTHALDGNGAQIKSISINPGLALWASYKGESIVDSQYIPSIVARLISSGMFDRDAGIRTFENGQETYPEHDHYQTGDNQFWPISTVMAADGMRQLGYQDEAKMVMLGNLTLIKSSGSFVEHRMKKDGRFLPLFEKSQNSINQTWTAATALFSTAFLLNAPAFGFKERAAS